MIVSSLSACMSCLHDNILFSPEEEVEEDDGSEGYTFTLSLDVHG